MTTTELRAEMDYRRNERLAIMGFYAEDTTPEWAKKQVDNEAEAWAMQNHHETYLQLINTK
jgi:hypothetical protein